MKSFKDYLNESPILNKAHDKQFMSTNSDLYRDKINKNHNKSDKIDNFHHQEIDKEHVYYKHDGNNVKEFTKINHNNEQTLVDKGKNGDANHIKNMIFHHVNKYGKVTSSNSNTEGSKHLWKDIITKHPNNMSVHHVNVPRKIDSEIDFDYLKHREDQIWNHNEFAKDHKIEIRRK